MTKTISVGYNDNMEIISYALVGRVDGGLDISLDNVPSTFLEDFILGMYKVDTATNSVVVNDAFEEEEPVISAPSDSTIMKSIIASQAIVMAQQDSQLEQKSKELEDVKKQLGLMAIVIAEVTANTNNEGESTNE